MLTATKGGTTLASNSGTQEELDKALGVETPTEPPKTDSPSAAVPEGESARTSPESEAGQVESEEEKKHKGGFQRKIDKLTRRARELEETLEEERLARQRLEAQAAGKPAAEVQAKPDADAEPSEDGLNPKTGKPWQDWKEFSKAHAQWAYRQAAQTSSEQTAEQAEQERLQTTLTSFVERRQAAEAKYEDWHEVSKLMSTPEGQFSEAAGLAIIELENGPDVLYKLGKDAELRTKLRGMSDLRQVVEIGRIAAELSAAAPAAPATPEPRSPEPPKSSAPAPLNPVSGASHAVVDRASMPLDEYVRRRNAGELK